VACWHRRRQWPGSKPDLVQEALVACWYRRRLWPGSKPDLVQEALVACWHRKRLWPGSKPGPGPPGVISLFTDVHANTAGLHTPAAMGKWPALFFYSPGRAPSLSRPPEASFFGGAGAGRWRGGGGISYQVNALRLLRQSRWPFARTTS
jgi:hypothetical protein